MTGPEREQLRSELDANTRLRMDVARLEDALLLAQNAVRYQKGRAEYWRAAAKRARARLLAKYVAVGCETCNGLRVRGPGEGRRSKRKKAAA